MKEVMKNEILAALSGKALASDAERIADILCRKFDPDMRIVDDAAEAVRRHWTPKQIMEDSLNEDKTMVELPAHLFYSAWVRQRIKDSYGLYASNAFIASAPNPAVQEILLLAEVLRLTYGHAGLPERMDATVFWQPAYAQFKNTAMPLLEEYIYPENAERVPIYIITEHGDEPDERSRYTLLDIVYRLWPEYRKAELTFAVSPRFNDPSVLVDILESRRYTDPVFLVHPEWVVPYGAAVTVSLLRAGIEQDPSATSWRILSDAVRRHEEDTGG